MKYKKFLLLLFFGFFYQITFANNSILAIVDDNVITFNQFNKIYTADDSKENKIKNLEKLIIELLEKDHISKFNIKPSEDLLNKELINLSQKNNINVGQLQQASNFDEILKVIIYKLSKIALFEMVVKTEKAKKNVIDLRTNEEIYKTWLNDIRNKTYIEVYEEKL